MKSEKWYESWFDSPLYEKLYANRDDTEAARLVRRLAGEMPPDRFPTVLDMGCGRGRHSMMLAEQGYTVTGVDLSPRAIKAAQQRAEAAGLKDIRFETGDMRSFTGGPFDLVCNLFTSFGYFEDDDDNKEVIQNMGSQLKENGMLVLDYMNAVHVRRNIVPVENVTRGNLRCHITRAIEGNTIVKTIYFNQEEDDEELQYQERVKLYEEEWFREAFKNAGLNIQGYFGDYSGSAFLPEYSPRLIIFAKK